ncbi:carboxymuconolactone decarboxylase family protein [Azospirillum sp. A39]|uniref:carboxymuconolactone decarboxylase family protein n=1 Tax=Azospirillum sp. A39 TaxID=3462279 RepID=UPI004045AD35
MTNRLNLLARRNGGVEAMAGVESWPASALEPTLLELVRTRASQINGSAFCLHMHREEARKHGETDDRLLLLNAWRDSALYSARERAALAWTESLTRIADDHAPDALYDEVSALFSDDELLALSIAVAMINAWNRLSIGFRSRHPLDRRRAA